MHPLGKSPVVTDGDVTLAESGAIIETLLERYGNGRLVPPAGSAERRRYTLLAALRRRVGDAAAAAEADLRSHPDDADAVLRQADRARHLGEGAGPHGHAEPDPPARLHGEASSRRIAWFAGAEFSAADIQMSFPLEAAAQRAGLDVSRPHLAAFLKRIHERPAYRKALERGGPYSFAND